MLTYIRHALATFFFAASVGCLSLWCGDKLAAISYLHIIRGVSIQAECGSGSILLYDLSPPRQSASCGVEVLEAGDSLWFAGHFASQGAFGAGVDLLYFPLWYPALIFALDGIASLRVGRRFTIRSAIIGTTVVAGLLGIVVIL